MNSKRMAVWSVLCLTLLAALPAAAAEKPINISLFSPLALVKPTDGVTSFRLNLIYGSNTSVKVVDLGFINQTKTVSSGLQWGAINYNEGRFSGLQLGTINYNKGATDGLQWGGFNYSGTASGLQLALVNYAAKLEGFQVGVLNIAKRGGMFPFMVIANWKK